MSNSQNDEEEKILAYYAHFATDNKRFLDIGAHDGKVFSNTCRLAELGWTGTLVEPSPAAFVGLMRNHEGRPDLKLVNTAIVPTECGFLCFGDTRGDFVSTSNPAHRALWGAPGVDGRPGMSFQDIYVSGTTFDKLFAQFPGPYSFVNLDVEGVNFELFQSLCSYGLARLGVDLICVEYQERYEDMMALATSLGYDLQHRTSENLLLARRR